MYQRHETGKEGEDLATEYLIKNGYKIVERNFDSEHGEIDIIAIEKNEIVFIEVKTRKSKQYGEPAEAVDYRKQKHLVSAIKYYVYLKNIENAFIRIDVIEVFLKENRHYINHIKNAINDVMI